MVNETLAFKPPGTLLLGTLTAPHSPKQKHKIDEWNKSRVKFVEFRQCTTEKGNKETKIKAQKNITIPPLS